MLKNTTTPDGYQVDENGERKTNGKDDNFEVSLDLNIDIKESKSEYILYIKSVAKNSDAEKLGLKANDEIVEIDGETFKENMKIYLDNIYDTHGKSKSVTDLAIDRFVSAISKSFNDMKFESIKFKKKDGKTIELSIEEIKQLLR